MNRLMHNVSINPPVPGRRISQGQECGFQALRDPKSSIAYGPSYLIFQYSNTHLPTNQPFYLLTNILTPPSRTMLHHTFKLPRYLSPFLYPTRPTQISTLKSPLLSLHLKLKAASLPHRAPNPSQLNPTQPNLIPPASLFLQIEGKHKYRLIPVKEAPDPRQCE